MQNFIIIILLVGGCWLLKERADLKAEIDALKTKPVEVANSSWLQDRIENRSNPLAQTPYRSGGVKTSARPIIWPYSTTPSNPLPPASTFPTNSR